MYGLINLWLGHMQVILHNVGIIEVIFYMFIVKIKCNNLGKELSIGSNIKCCPLSLSKHDE